MTRGRLWLVIFLSGLEKSPKVRLKKKVYEKFGVSRFSMYRALKRLEKAGLVLVTRKRGCSLQVTILDVSEQGQ